MLYVIGSRIDLTYLNRKVVADAPKKSISETAGTLYQVGTRFIFNLTPEGLKATIKIPVGYA